MTWVVGRAVAVSPPVVEEAEMRVAEGVFEFACRRAAAIAAVSPEFLTTDSLTRVVEGVFEFACLRAGTIAAASPEPLKTGSLTKSGARGTAFLFLLGGSCSPSWSPRGL